MQKPGQLTQIKQCSTSNRRPTTHVVLVSHWKIEGFCTSDLVRGPKGGFIALGDGPRWSLVVLRKKIQNSWLSMTKSFINKHYMRSRPSITCKTLFDLGEQPWFLHFSNTPVPICLLLGAELANHQTSVGRSAARVSSSWRQLAIQKLVAEKLDITWAICS